MSRTIDEKVVSLQFENDQFEKKVQQSIDSLNRFEKASKFDGAKKGIEELEDAAKKFDLKVLVSGVDEAKNKFNGLKEVGIGALRAIGNFLTMEFAPNFIKTMSGIETFYQGYSKYEDKVKSVQTLLNSTGRDLDNINGYLDKLMRFSDETSYGFNEMAGSLAQLTTNGGDIERLVPMITGIANAVAFAGKGPAEFSRAIYNLNQSYGAGALKYMDWKSLELAGVASKELKQSFIETAIELGRLNKNGQTVKKTIVDIGNFSETLKEGWADTTVMEETFGKFAKYTQMADELVEAGKFDTYSDAYKYLAQDYDDIYLRAAKAAQEAKTFNEAIDATKDAVSSKWLKSFELFFGDYTQAKETWTNLANDLYDIFASAGDVRNDVLAKAFSSNYDQIKNVMTESGLDFEDYDKSFKTFLKDNGWNVEKLIQQYGSLANALGHGNAIIESEASPNRKAGIANLLSKFTKDYVEKLKESVGDASDAVDSLAHIQQIYNDIWSGKYGNGEERINKLAEAGLDYATVQYDLVNKMAELGHKAGYELTAKDIEHLSEAQLENLGVSKKDAAAIKEFIASLEDADAPLSKILEKLNQKSGQVLLSETITNITGTIKNLKNILGEFWKNLFGWDFSEIIYDIVLKVHDFTEAIKNATGNSAIIEKIKTVAPVIKNAFSSIDKLGNSINTLFKTLKEGLVGTITRLIQPSLKAFKDNVVKLVPSFDKVKISLSDFVDGLTTGVDRMTEWIKNSGLFTGDFSKLTTIVNSAIDSTRNFIGQFVNLENVKSLFDGISDSVSKWISKFIDLNKVSMSIKDALAYLKNLSFESAFNDLKKLPVLLWNAVKNLSFENIINNLRNLPLSFANAFKRLKTIKLSSFFKSLDIHGFVNKIVEKIKDIPNTIVSVFSNLKKINLSDYFNFDFFKSEEFINTIKGSPILSVLAGIGIAVGNLVKGIYNTVRDGIKAIYPIVEPYLEGFREKVVELSEKIIEASKRAVDWLSNNNVILETIQNGAELIGNAIDRVKKWLEQFVQIESVSENISSILNNIKNFSLKNLSFDTIRESAEGFFGTVNTKFNELKDKKLNINDFLKPLSLSNGLSAVNADMIKGFNDIINTIEDTISKLDIDWDKLSSITTEIRKRFEQLAGFLTGYVLVSGIGKAMNSVSTFLNGLLTPIETINDVLKSFAGVGKQLSTTIGQVGTSISGYFNQMTKNVKTENILKVAIAITILTAAMYVLAKIDPIALLEAIGAIAALLTIVAVFNHFVGKSSKSLGDVSDNGINKLTALMLGMAAAVTVLSIALKNFEQINDITQSALLAIGSMIALVVGVGSLIAIMKKYGDKDAIVSAGMLIGFAGSIYILAVALQKMSKIHFEDIGSAIAGFIGSVILMLAASRAIKGLNAGASLPILSIVGTLFVLSKALDKLSSMDLEKSISGIMNLTISMISAIPLLVSLVVAMKLLNSISTDFLGMAAFTISLIASVFLFGKAIEKLGEIDKNLLIKGGATVSVLMIVMGIIASFTAWISSFNPKTKEATSWKNIIAMGVLIGSIAISLYALAGAVLIFKNMDVDELIKGVGSVVALLLGIGGMVGLMGKAVGNFNPNSVKALATLITMIALVAGSIFVLSFLDTNKLIVSVGSIVSVLGTLGLLFFTISKFGTTNLGQVGIALASMAVILAEVGAALYVLTTNIKDPQVALQIANGLSEVIAALSGAILALSIAGSLASISLSTVGPLLSVFAALLTVVTVASAILSQNADISQEDIDRFAMFMKGFGDAIGGFAGSLIENIGGGLIASIANGLERIGASIAGFVESVKPLFEMETPSDFTAKITAVSSVIDVFGAKTFINSIRTLGQNNNLNFEKVGEFFSAYATVITSFSDEIKTISPAKLDSAAKIGEMFTNLSSSLGRSGGLIDLIVGKKTNLEDFGRGMNSYARALVNMSNILVGGTEGSGFNSDALTIAATAGETMRELETSLGSKGGLLQKIIGESDLGDFGDRITSFARGLVEMSNIFVNGDEETGSKGFNDAVLERVVKAGEALRDLEDSVASSKSLMSLLKGSDEGNLGDFGARIKKFAEGLTEGLNAFTYIQTTTSKEFSTITETIPGAGEVSIRKSLNPDRFEILGNIIDSVIELSGKFVELENSLNPTEGTFSGGSNIKALGKGIASFAGSFKSFVNDFPPTIPDTEQVQKMLDISTMIAEMAESDNMSGIETTLSAAGEKVKQYASGLKEIVNSVLAGDSTTESEGESAAEGFGSSFLGIFGSLFNNEQLTEQVETGATETGTTYLSSLSKVLTESDAVKSLHKNVDKTVQELIKHFSESEYEGHKMTTVGIFTTMGKNWVKGLADGMDEMAISVLYPKAEEIAKKTSQIVGDNWMVNSPSKVAYELGSFFVMGLTNGISDLSEDAIATAGDAANKISNAVQMALHASDDILNSEYNPIISPVLDTANILEGAKSINGLLSSEDQYDAALNISSARLGIQNGVLGKNSSGVTVNFTVNNAGRDLSEADVMRYSRQIANEVNRILGSAI